MAKKFPFEAQPGTYSSVVGQSVHLIGPDGRFLGQVLFASQDDSLRTEAVQSALVEVITTAINSAEE